MFLIKTRDGCELLSELYAQWITLERQMSCRRLLFDGRAAASFAGLIVVHAGRRLGRHRITAAVVARGAAAPAALAGLVHAFLLAEFSPTVLEPNLLKSNQL